MRIRSVTSILLALILAGCQVRPRLQHLAEPESVGMDSTRLRSLDSLLREALERRAFPGAVLLVARKGRTVWRKAYGDKQWIPHPVPMQTSMIFDLASITKPVATATSAMILVERGRLSLWEKVRAFVPSFTAFKDASGKPGEDVRIWHLLTHTSGLPAYADAAELERTYGNPISLKTMVWHIAGMEKTHPPGEVFRYSCLGYITLGYIIQSVSGKPLDEFAAEHIFRPLGMRHTFYRPRPEFLSRCVPTEVVDGRSLVGVVHDPLARLLGGVSGNAGLFSTADDLAVFAQMMLNRGEYGGVRILSPLGVERMTEIFRRAGFSGRGLGWDVDSSYAINQGDLFGPRAYGHTGYTGTSLIVDPDSETLVVFLTNRVHPEDKGEVVAVRSRVANIVASAILED